MSFDMFHLASVIHSPGLGNEQRRAPCTWALRRATAAGAISNRQKSSRLYRVAIQMPAKMGSSVSLGTDTPRRFEWYRRRGIKGRV